MPNVSEFIRDRATLTMDCAIRLYLNASAPRLETEGASALS